ncbi:MAG: hypothetical protein U1A77_02925 [Pirellulales bacterium]
MKMGIGKKSLAIIPMLLVAAMTLVGCGGDNTPKGDLHGKVTMQGGSLPAGCTLAFVGDKGGGTAAIDSSGNFKTMGGIPVGSYKVIVTPPSSNLSPEEAMKASMEGKAAAPTGVPAKYIDPATTDLKAEVKAGDTEVNFELTAE